MDQDTDSSLAERLVTEGCLTVEQKTQIEDLVKRTLAAHGGDEQATLAADVDGRFLDIIRGVKAAGGKNLAELAETLLPAGDYEVERPLAAQR